MQFNRIFRSYTTFQRGMIMRKACVIMKEEVFCCLLVCLLTVVDVIKFLQFSVEEYELEPIKFKKIFPESITIFGKIPDCTTQ